MQGIQSLMPGQAQQAPMPMPQQSSSTPGAMTGSLKNMPMEQLKMLFQNPQPGSPPLWAVISALAEKQKEAQAVQAAMGQGAMAQNAQMQQQPPVAAQVVQAAQGGIMQGYAGGGAVAFAGGTGPEGLPQENPEDLSDDPNLPLRERMARAQRRMALSRQQGVGRSFAERFPAPVESTTDTGDELSRMLGRAPAPVPMSMRDTRSVTPATVAAARNLGIGQPQQRQQRQEAAQAAPMASATGITSTLSPEEARLFEERKAALEARKRLPPELLEGRTGLAKLMQENLAAQRAEAKTFGDEARAARDAAIARSQRSLLDDPQALLAMAGAIDPRRGRSIGSLAQGAAGVLGQRQAAAEAARKEYATSQQTERMLQANIRQGNMLEAQRVQALLEGEYNRANQIDDAINQNAAERAKLERSVQEKQFQQAMEGRKVAADEGRTRAAMISAGKPNEMDVALNQPEAYARLLKARAEATQARVSPEERRAATMERYADNWEKLDVMQKSELAKQGVTNFQQYVRMRDQMAGNTGAAGAKTMTMADVQATATSSGKTVEEVKKAAIAAGYTIQ
jgi:hypothetical protein